MAKDSNRFAFISGLVDPNSIYIRNNYVYFKYSNPKTLIKSVEDTSVKVKQVTATEQAKEIAESKEEVESGKRSLPEEEPYEEPPVKRKKRDPKPSRVAVYSSRDILD